LYPAHSDGTMDLNWWFSRESFLLLLNLVSLWYGYS